MIAAMTEAPKEAGPFGTAKTVLWSFFGICRWSGHEADINKLSPQQVVFAGLIGGVFLVLTIILVVRLVLRLAPG